jgi:hypothetical protein
VIRLEFRTGDLTVYQDDMDITASCDTVELIPGGRDCRLHLRADLPGGRVRQVVQGSYQVSLTGVQ